MDPPPYKYVDRRLCEKVPASPAESAKYAPVNAPNGVETLIVPEVPFDDLTLYLVTAEPDPSSTELSNAHDSYAKLQQAYRDKNKLEFDLRKYRLSPISEEDKNREVALKVATDIIGNAGNITDNLQQAVAKRFEALTNQAKEFLKKYSKYSFIVYDGPEVIQRTTEYGNIYRDVAGFVKQPTYLAFVNDKTDMITIPFVRSGDRYRTLKGFMEGQPAREWWENDSKANATPTVTGLVNAVLESNKKDYSVGPRIEKAVPDADPIADTDANTKRSNMYKSFLTALRWHDYQLDAPLREYRQQLRDDAIKALDQKDAEAQKARERLAQQQRNARVAEQAAEPADIPQPSVFTRAWNRILAIKPINLIMGLIVIAIIVGMILFFKNSKSKKQKFSSSMCRSMPQYSYSQPWVL
jgi:hypothetical protein